MSSEFGRLTSVLCRLPAASCLLSSSARRANMHLLQISFAWQVALPSTSIFSLGRRIFQIALYDSKDFPSYLVNWLIGRLVKSSGHRL